MTPDQAALVQQSFQKIGPMASTAADIFYRRLFDTCPDVRPLFPADMREQKDKLMRTLGVAVQNLHHMETILPVVRGLGEKHVAYGVKDEQYEAVGAALLYTLEAGLGEDWTPELAAAWEETYAVVSGAMRDAARESAAARSAATAPARTRGLLARLFG